MQIDLTTEEVRFLRSVLMLAQGGLAASRAQEIERTLALVSAHPATRALIEAVYEYDFDLLGSLTTKLGDER